MDNIYFWSPSVQFKTENGELKVECFNYGKKCAEFFPELYYIAQDGATPEQLKEHFPENKRVFLNSLIRDFIKKKILVKSVITPAELFYSQKKLFHNEYPDDMRFVREKLEAFRIKQTNRRMFSGDVSYILEKTGQGELLENRCSVREFSDDVISYYDFSSVMGILQSKPETHKRYYPSAGGLAVIDVYVHIKAGRVEGIREGLYYYDPVVNSIVFMNDGKGIVSDAHYFTNKEISEGSAFTVYFVYNVGAGMPKYGGMSYYYGIIESGILIAMLTMSGEKTGIGSCSIGDMVYEKIAPCFNLNDNQILLHSMEFGYKKNR
ncbi:MAG: SagB/ThcOx family dehydrogenase [Ruminococcus sp.]|nr:SagB/ThcOx family dehydrogenase [Ruminococcus sp.]MDE6847914.1 SagB/ThcOx family dehydrogenase [Ruminococcus sp.]MDE7137725.1 SagB/ThcOx family dehydrogenase [Ruminococcus sp.]